MNDKIKALLNEQINKELYSAYLYVDIANYYDELDLDGYANYYMVQAQEERDQQIRDAETYFHYSVDDPDDFDFKEFASHVYEEMGL